MQITVHAMVNGEGEYVQTLADFVRRYQQEIRIYDLGKVTLPVIPTHSNDKTSYPLEAYYRLFATEVLPLNIHKILYLDGDIIVNRSLRDLWDIDITGYALAAAAGLHNNNKQLIDKLGYAPKYGYFNSGVLLINLDYWRNNYVVEKFVDFIKANMDNLKYADQDVLNPVFCDKRLELPLKYNFCTTFLYNDCYRHLEKKYVEEIDNCYQAPCVIHYTSDKPWYSDSRNIYRDIWRYYRDKTEWRGYFVKKKESVIIQSFRRFLSCIKHGVYSSMYVKYNKKYKLTI